MASPDPKARCCAGGSCWAGDRAESEGEPPWNAVEAALSTDERLGGVDRALDFLYGDERTASLGKSAPYVPTWLGDIRRYFPARSWRSSRRTRSSGAAFEAATSSPRLRDAGEGRRAGRDDSCLQEPDPRPDTTDGAAGGGNRRPSAPPPGEPAPQALRERCAATTTVRSKSPGISAISGAVFFFFCVFFKNSVVLSKISTVHLTIRRGGRVVWTNSATVEHGRPRLLWVTPSAGGSFSVTLTASDLAGNFSTTNGTILVTHR